MENNFVPYELALELKELGFDEPCLGFYRIFSDGDVELLINSNSDMRQLEAPLFQQVFKFFREKYQLHSTITSISQESWQWHITKPGESLGKLYDEDFYTYEEAELACLKKLIEINKQK